MHYFDLTRRNDVLEPFGEGIEDTFPDVRLVGWLVPDMLIETGETDDELLESLFLHCQRPVHLTRGHFPCQLCSWPWEVDMIAQRGTRGALLGSGEVLVVGSQNDAYLAPTLIYHYITAHHYLPPSCFLEALRVSDPERGTTLSREAYRRLFGEIGVEAFDRAYHHRISLTV